MKIEIHEQLPVATASPGRPGGWAHKLREAAKAAAPNCISVQMAELPVNFNSKNTSSIIHANGWYGRFATRIRDGRLYVQYLGPALPKEEA